VKISDESIRRIARKTGQEEYSAGDSLYYWRAELSELEDNLLSAGERWYDMAWDAWDQAHALADEGDHAGASERLDAVERIVEKVMEMTTTLSGSPVE